MGKKQSKREAGKIREVAGKAETFERAMPRKPKTAKAPAKEYVPPVPEQPKSYKGFIERHKLIVSHDDIPGVGRRICVRKGRVAVILFSDEADMAGAAWASKGRKLHHLIKGRKNLEWELASASLVEMLGQVGFDHLMALYDEKAALLAAEAAASSLTNTHSKYMKALSAVKTDMAEAHAASTNVTFAEVVAESDPEEVNA